MAIIINYDLPDNITVNILPTGETVVNVLPKSTIVVNLCNDNGQSTTDYAALTGKPKINDVELIGNKTLTQLGIEPKRGADDFYVTGDEKAKLGKLLVDFTVPTDTPSLEFLYTDGGALLSSLGLKRVILSGKFITDIAAAAGSERLSINRDNTNTYASAVSSSVLGGFRFPVFKLMAFDAVLSITNNSCVFSGSVHASQNTTVVNTNTLTNVSLSGLKDGATTINSIKIERLNNVFVFKAGSTIKIYRND